MISPRGGGALHDLEPGYFALVMATGIVSVAMVGHRPSVITDVLLWLALIEYAVLVALHGWRVLAHRDAVARDLGEPRRAFGMLTFVAATDVLGARIAMDDHHAAGLALLLVGSLAWLVLGYVVPWVAASGRGRRPTLQDADGTWFMWVVAGQSVAVLAATLAPEITEGRRELALLAVVAWAVGVFLYAAAGIFVAARLLRYPVRPDEVTPPYWIAMGATAITVVAGADIVRMSVSPIARAVRNVVEGGSVLFWAFGTWLIPPLIAVGVWRHVRHRIPLRYEPALWSIVFPIGMYGVGSHTLGLAAHLSVITEIGIHEAWVAAGVWLVTFVAMGCHLLRPARHVSPDDRLTAGAAPRSEMRPSGEH